MTGVEEIKSVTFDSYTTLVDVYSQADVLAEKIDGVSNPNYVSRLWRLRNMMYTVIANDINAYRPFYEIQNLSLEFALTSCGYDIPKSARDDICRAVYKQDIKVFDDVHSGLERLSQGGYDCYVISNGDPDMLERMVEQANIGELIEDTISADEVEVFKPDPRIYEHGASRVDTSPEHILHVSGGTMRDVWGANNVGMQTAWLNRPGKHYPEESLGVDPDIVVRSIHDVADQLLSSV